MISSIPVRGICITTDRRACLTLPARILTAALAIGISGCDNPFSHSDSTAIFVMRAAGGQTLPATFVSGSITWTLVADTLFVPVPRRSNGAGVLLQKTVSRVNANGATQLREQHTFTWKESYFSVLFGCEVRTPCITIFAPEAGELHGRDLTFPAGDVPAATRYERIQ